MVAASVPYLKAMINCTTDAQERRALQKRFGVSAYPTVLLCDPWGRVVESMSARTPATVAAQLKRVAALDFRTWKPPEPVVVRVAEGATVVAGAFRVKFGCAKNRRVRYRLSGAQPARIVAVNAGGATVEEIWHPTAMNTIYLPEDFGQAVRLRLYPISTPSRGL